MKKIFLLMSLTLIVISFSSCANEEIVTTNGNVDKVIAQDIYINDIDEQIELNSIYNKIDSINNLYTLRNASTRTFLDWAAGNFTEAAADHVGKIAGQWIGKYVGTGLGSLTGNPVVAIGGYVGGRFAGGIVGALGASYAANAVLNWSKNYNYKTPCYNFDYLNNIVLDSDFIKTKTDSLMNSDFEVKCNSDSLSFGELHNIIIYKLLKNGDKYINTNGTLDYISLLEDCSKYAEEYDIEHYEANSIENYKKDIIDQIKLIQISVLEFRDNKSTSIEDFYDLTYGNLSSAFNIDKDEFYKQAQIDYATGKTYATLNDTELKEYEKDIDNIITNSNLNDENKKTLKNSNSIIANSTLLWRNIN